MNLTVVETPGTELDDLGDRVKALREEKGYSLRELARRAGLTHTTIGAIEAGRIDPSLGTLKRVLAACGVRMWEFFHQASGLTAVVPREQITTITSGCGHMR